MIMATMPVPVAAMLVIVPVIVVIVPVMLVLVRHETSLARRRYNRFSGEGNQFAVILVPEVLVAVG